MTKPLFWILLLTGVFGLSLTTAVMVGLASTEREAQEHIIANQQEIMKKLNEKTKDRYHGADARRDFAAVNARLEALERERKH